MSHDERILPPISVVVCTRDRHDMLRQCLASLAQLDYPDFHVVVVDNAPTDERTRLVVSEAGFGYVCERTPGLDWARNAGIAAARHDIIAFTDDDVRVDAAWLRAIAAALADPAVAGVTGLVLPAELATPAQHWFEAYGHGMSKGDHPRLFHRDDMTPRQLIRAQDVGVGANMAFRRSALEAIGGFDTAMDVGTPAQGAGDLDIFHRLLMAGSAIRYEPSARVYHVHRRDAAGLRRQLQANGRCYGVYLRKLWHAGQLSRWAIFRYAVEWGVWLVGRSVRCLFIRGPLPRTMVWAELWGALHAPWAYRATRNEDRRRRTARSA